LSRLLEYSSRGGKCVGRNLRLNEWNTKKNPACDDEIERLEPVERSRDTFQRHIQ
jgi:hypothetical protein